MNCMSKYSGGKISTLNEQYGKKLHEMLEYMVSGKKPTDPDNDINNLDKLVTGVKSKSEVTKSYMRQWEREIALQREAAAEAVAETKKEDAIAMIRFTRELNADDNLIRARLKEDLELTDEIIDDLFKKVDSSDNILAKL